jgi:hypothetical protein
MTIVNSTIISVMIIIIITVFIIIIIIPDTDVFELYLLFRCYILALSVYILSLYLYSCSLCNWPLSC